MFKNITTFSLTEKFELSAEELAEKLAAFEFASCTGQQAFSMGWTAPLGKGSEELVHSSNGFMMVCLRKEERLLPATVINEMWQARIDEIEEAEGRKLSKKARAELKDDLIFELLPRAFTHSTKLFAYIDTENDFIVIDSASSSKAEDLLSLLRKTLGGLPTIPVNTVDSPVFTMTNWLTHDTQPPEISIDDECELRSPEEGGGIARFKRHDLNLPEIKNHLETGKQVIKLALTWNDRISFVLDADFKITRLKFLELVQDRVLDEKNNSNAETEEERFDVDFIIMTAELSEFLNGLISIFGGKPQEISLKFKNIRGGYGDF